MLIYYKEVKSIYSDLLLSLCLAYLSQGRDSPFLLLCRFEDKRNFAMLYSFKTQTSCTAFMGSLLLSLGLERLCWLQIRRCCVSSSSGGSFTSYSPGHLYFPVSVELLPLCFCFRNKERRLFHKELELSYKVSSYCVWEGLLVLT